MVRRESLIYDIISQGWVKIECEMPKLQIFLEQNGKMSIVRDDSDRSWHPSEV